MSPFPAIAAFLLLALATGVGAAVPPPLEPGEPGRVETVVDGDTVILEDGRRLRLVGIQAPKLPLGRPDFEPWPLADEARDALSALVLGRSVALGYGGRRLDRHGRVLAHLHLADGTWVQGALLRSGMARVYSFADNRALVAEMLALEGEARAERAGIWGHPHHAVRQADGADEVVGDFALVEGRVVSAATVRGRTYLNFGADWRTDFTVSWDRAAARLFDAVGLAPSDFEGREIRVRGWVTRYNGPLIEVDHPEQIELDPWRVVRPGGPSPTR